MPVKYKVGDKIRIVESFGAGLTGEVNEVITTNFGRDFLVIMLDSGEEVRRNATYVERIEA